MILADTNIWVRHVRRGDPRLVRLLLEQRIVTCDVVIGELLLGSGMPPDLEIELPRLPRVPSPTASATMDFVFRHRPVFTAAGVGWADAQIIVAAQDSGALLLSSDAAVRAVWRSLGHRLP